MKVKIVFLNTGYKMEAPTYQSDGAAGVDLYAAEDILVMPGWAKPVGTGIALEIPEGYEGQVRPRSGLAFNHNVTVLNSPGTIDSDYRGEVRVLLVNFGMGDFRVTKGMRIAQMVFNKFEKVEFVESKDLSETDRGNGGFGSTGH